MKDIIVFSHMMKTAGSSLLKNFIYYYGVELLYINRGSRIGDNKYNLEYLKKDLKKKKGKEKIIAGHCFRPHMNMDLQNYNLRWFTFLRNPKNRYLSHYFHTRYFLTNNFNKGSFKNMKNKNIVEWEKISGNSNYQCKFIAGEPNSQKAIDILEKKFEWVGITKEFDQGINSLKTHFQIEDLDYTTNLTNASLAKKEEKTAVMTQYADFIQDMNKEDEILYKYVKDNIWPRHKKVEPSRNLKLKSNSLLKQYNMLAFHIDNKLNFNKTKINKNNLIRFYKRWLK